MPCSAQNVERRFLNKSLFVKKEQCYEGKKGIVICLIIALCLGMFCACGSDNKGSGKSSGKGGVSSDTDTKKEDSFFEDVGNDPNNLLQDRGQMAFDDDYIYYVKEERTTRCM